MTTIILAVSDQQLVITQKPKLASGNRNSVKVKVNFSSEWLNYSKTAIFYKEDEPIYPALLDKNDECIIPWEVLADDGTMFIGVFGVRDNITKTSEVIRYTVLQGAWSSELAESVPTPDIYTQFLAEVQASKDLVRETFENEKLFEERSEATLENAKSATVACYDAINALNLAWVDYDGAFPETQATENDLDMNGGYPSNMEV